MLLDSRKIRSGLWHPNPIWNTLENLRLPNDDISVAIDPSQLTAWPGETQYEPLLELGIQDPTTVVDRSHARYINHRFISGRIINGHFTKGEW
jgi:hypothetical protein